MDLILVREHAGKPVRDEIALKIPEIAAVFQLAHQNKIKGDVKRAQTPAGKGKKLFRDFGESRERYEMLRKLEILKQWETKR